MICIAKQLAYTTVAADGCRAAPSSQNRTGARIPESESVQQIDSHLPVCCVDPSVIIGIHLQRGHRQAASWPFGGQLLVPCIGIYGIRGDVWV